MLFLLRHLHPGAHLGGGLPRLPPLRLDVWHLPGGLPVRAQDVHFPEVRLHLPSKYLFIYSA